MAKRLKAMAINSTKKLDAPFHIAAGQFQVINSYTGHDTVFSLLLNAVGRIVCGAIFKTAVENTV